jgi:hypothetical protein
MMRTRARYVISVAAIAALALCIVAPRAQALPETSLMISEFFFDPVGPNGRRQWVELYNSSGSDILLTGNYSLGFGDKDYTRTTVDLVGTILAGSTFVVGGDISDALNMNPTLDQAIVFSPAAGLGDNRTWLDGIALFNLPAASIAALSDPIHTLIYGEATASARSNLTDETGVAGSGTPDVTLPTSGITGQSIEFDGATWQTQATPTPNMTAVPEPSSAVLVALGLVGFAAKRRLTRKR